MPTQPRTILHLLGAFAPVFSRRVWRSAQVLVAGALLTPGKRTVAAALRVTGLASIRRFERYHRVLNRACWSSLAVSRILLRLLVAAFVPDGPLVVGVDETIERRRGTQIAAKGIYRDAVRSSRSHFVKASGLRRVSLTLLTPIPWAGPVWALPFLTALAPSERYDEERGRRHKTLPDWARQLLLMVRRWQPGRAIVAVAGTHEVGEQLRRPRVPGRLPRLAEPGDGGHPAAPGRRPLRPRATPPAGQVGRPRRKGQRLPTLAAVAANPKTVWTSVTVADWYGQGECTVEVAADTAVWYHGGMPSVPLRWVLIRDPQGAFATQALLSTDQEAKPEQLLAWFVLRWQLKVTFEEARRHLGVETQRQWSELAIRRATPALLGLFSLVTLHAHQQAEQARTPVRRAAWYPKALPTFSDARAVVRRELWTHEGFALSARDPDVVQLPRTFVVHLTETLAYAA